MNKYSQSTTYDCILYRDWECWFMKNEDNTWPNIGLKMIWLSQKIWSLTKSFWTGQQNFLSEIIWSHCQSKVFDQQLQINTMHKMRSLEFLIRFLVCIQKVFVFLSGFWFGNIYYWMLRLVYKYCKYKFLLQEEIFFW